MILKMVYDHVKLRSKGQNHKHMPIYAEKTYPIIFRPRDIFRKTYYILYLDNTIAFYPFSGFRFFRSGEYMQIFGEERRVICIQEWLSSHILI